MLSLELAKKLKELGFPMYETSFGAGNVFEDGFHYWIYPNLLELIENITYQRNYVDGSFFLKDYSYNTDIERIVSWEAGAKFASQDQYAIEDSIEDSVAKLLIISMKSNPVWPSLP